MAGSHQQCAENRHAALTEKAVCQITAADWEQVSETGIEPVDLRGERLRLKRTEQALERSLHGAITDDSFDVARQQQVLHQVENQQRRHPVIGKALPHLCGEQDRQPFRMAEELCLSGISFRWSMHERCGLCGFADMHYPL